MLYYDLMSSAHEEYTREHPNAEEAISNAIEVMRTSGLILIAGDVAKIRNRGEALSEEMLQRVSQIIGEMFAYRERVLPMRVKQEPERLKQQER